MKLALDEAKVRQEDVNYINAHATSTPAGDVAEIAGIKRLFKDIKNDLYVSSLKGQLGHLLGAAGAVESIFTILSCKERIIAPSINIKKLDPELKLDESEFIKIVQNEKKVVEDIKSGKFIALKNSFGFGGTNVSLCLSSYNRD